MVEEAQILQVAVSSMKTWATFLILWLAAAAHADTSGSTNADLDSDLGSLFGTSSEYPDSLPPTLGEIEAELNVLGRAASPGYFGDFGPALAALNDLGPSLDALGPSLDDLGSSLDALGPSLDALGPSLDDLSSGLLGAEAPELEQLLDEFIPGLEGQTGRRLLRGG